MIGQSRLKREENTERKYREEKWIIKMEGRRGRKSLKHFQPARNATLSGRR